MKPLALLALAMLAAGCGGHSQPAAAPTPYAPRSWCLYYGGPRDDLADRLGGHDLVVVDPAALGDKAAETVAALHARGCRVAGYLSAVEIARWHTYRDRVDPAWHILLDGKLWVPWGGTGVGWEANLAVSLAEPGWRALLAELVDRDILGCGCDGVFFDTLEDLDRPELPADEALRQREGLRILLRDLREAHPGALLFANRTLGATLEVVAESGDGICWEDFAVAHFENPETRSWMTDIVSRIEACRERRGPGRPFLVLALWDAPEDLADFPARREAMHALAAAHDYLPYCCRGGYMALPPE